MGGGIFKWSVMVNGVVYWIYYYVNYLPPCSALFTIEFIYISEFSKLPNPSQITWKALPGLSANARND